MALRPSDLDRRKPPFVEDERPLPTDEEVANHLGINPDVFKTPSVEGSQAPTPKSKPEGPGSPGEGRI